LILLETLLPPTLVEMLAVEPTPRLKLQPNRKLTFNIFVIPIGIPKNGGNPLLMEKPRL
jgi:hypothetical protein